MYAVESAFRSPMRIVNFDETINEKVENIKIPDWITISFVENQGTIAQIANESIIFADGFVTL